MKLKFRTRFEISPLPPFDFRLTVRKPAGWSLFTSAEVYEDETLWTGIRSGARPVGLKIKSQGTLEKPRVLVGVYSGRAVSGAESERLREILSVCLGAEQDLTGFYGFARSDGILKHVVESLYGMHDTQAASLFNSVILAICLQMARLKRSNQMMEAIDREYGETIEFDGKRILLQPTAARVAKLDPVDFAKACKLGYRADIINPHAGFPIDAWSVDVFGLLFFGKQPENRRDAIEAVKEEGIRRWGTWSWMAFFYVAQDLRNLSKKLGIKLRLE